MERGFEAGLFIQAQKGHYKALFTLYQYRTKGKRMELVQRDMDWIFSFTGAKTRKAAKIVQFPPH
jgi:hypothetical protein